MNSETLREITFCVVETLALAIVLATLGRSQSFSELFHSTVAAHGSALRAESDSQSKGQYSEIRQHSLLP